jgi:hypothetical protein
LASCNSHYKKELELMERELIRLNNSLDLIIEKRHNYYHTINEYLELDYTDSIFFQGNRIVWNMDDEDFVGKYHHFFKIHGNGDFEMTEWHDNETLLKTRMKIVQLYSIDNEIFSLFDSHVQVYSVNLRPLDKTVSSSKDKVIELYPHYWRLLLPPPIAIIDKDTLKYNEFSDTYEYLFEKQSPGDYEIKMQLIYENWGKMRYDNCSFIIHVQ